MMKSQLEVAKLVPTWSAYNSLFKVPQNSAFLNSSPTDWSNLYVALKIVQIINIICTPKEKTIL